MPGKDIVLFEWGGRLIVWCRRTKCIRATFESSVKHRKHGLIQLKERSVVEKMLVKVRLQLIDQRLIVTIDIVKVEGD